MKYYEVCRVHSQQLHFFSLRKSGNKLQFFSVSFFLSQAPLSLYKAQARFDFKKFVTCYLAESVEIWRDCSSQPTARKTKILFISKKSL